MTQKTLLERCREQLDGARAWELLSDLDAAIAQQAEPADEQAELKAAAKELEAMLFDTGPEESAPLIERQLWARGREERMDALRAALQTRGKNDSEQASGMPDERAAFEAATPGWDTDMTAHEAGIAWAAWQAGRAALQTRGNAPATSGMPSRPKTTKLWFGHSDEALADYGTACYAAGRRQGLEEARQHDGPRAIGVSRMFDNDRAVLVSFVSAPTDDQLRALHELLQTRGKNDSEVV